MSLGYENNDERLSRLTQSPVTASASADWQREAVPGLLRLPRLAPSRRVSCTNPCTNPVLDLRKAVRLAHKYAPLVPVLADLIDRPDTPLSAPAKAHILGQLRTAQERFAAIVPPTADSARL